MNPTLTFIYFILMKCVSTASTNLNCTCVPYYQCTEDLDNFITDGIGLFDIRGYQTGQCKGYFDVCCNATINLETTTEISEKPRGCGYQHAGIFPWSGALLKQQNLAAPHKYKCGVSLIHPQVVITAAHCISSNEILTTHIGNSLSVVKTTITHPDYNPETLQNDIALLVFAEPIELSDKVNIICIPSPGIILDFATCIASAWNKNSFIKNPNSFLKMVKLPIMPRQTCLASLRETRLGPYFQLHKSFICAGGKGKRDVCSGDGGSPLVCPIPSQPGRYHQVGIVSWGIGCGEDNTPGVYVNLPFFRDWIDEEMTKLGFEVNGYRY